MDLAPVGGVRRVMTGLLIGSLTALSAAGVRANDEEPRTVEAVDLERYAGKWYEIARFPNRFQRDCIGDVAATYARRPDGRIDVTNRCRTADGLTKEARGVARVVDAETNAKLEVRFAPAALSFLPFVWGDYWIIGLDPAYQWAVVGSPDRDYLWILSRTPAVAEADWTTAVGIARAAGFDTGRLVRTRQSAAAPPG
jgi:apolipoprotein D and lipocalin family protein